MPTTTYTPIISIWDLGELRCEGCDESEFHDWYHDLPEPRRLRPMFRDEQGRMVCEECKGKQG